MVSPEGFERKTFKERSNTEHLNSKNACLIMPSPNLSGSHFQKGIRPSLEYAFSMMVMSPYPRGVSS